MFRFSFSRKAKRITFAPVYNGAKNILLIDDIKNKTSIDYNVALGKIVYSGKGKLF